jgi:glycosyltransferase involved in cell wall biosynthesis
MRIVFISSSTTLSGGTRQAAYLAKGLAEKGHDVSFLVPKGAEIMEIEPDVDWRTLPDSRLRWKSAIDEAVAGSGQPAVVHAFHNKAVKALAWWGLFRGKRPIITLGHRGVVYRPGNPLPYWSPGVDAFTANSWACAGVLKKIGVSKKRLHVVYNGLPDNRTTPEKTRAEMRGSLGLPHDAKVIGTVAGDKPVKGVEVLIKAFAALTGKPRLVLVGARAARWSDMLEKLQVSGRAICTGRVENIADHMQLFDVFVLPSLSESMPNTLIEAIRMGLPAIATRVGGVPELVEENGLLVPSGDHAALATAMQEILGHDKRRAAMAAMSRKMAPRFSLEHKVERSLRVYAQVMESKGVAAAGA